jgi:hypothetical protein
MRRNGWRSRLGEDVSLRGPVKPGGMAWSVAGLVLLLATTELAVLPALSASGWPSLLQMVAALVIGAGIRLGLGAFVAWRLQRAGVDETDTVVRTVAAGLLGGLLFSWLASVLVVRPPWGIGEWATELGRLAVGAALWVVPCALGAYWFMRRALPE